MSNIYIVSAKRSPIGNFLGGLSSLSLVELASQTLEKSLESDNIDKNIIDQFILGNVLSAGQGQGPARQISIKAGINQSIPAYSLNMICGSGLKAIVNSYCQIKAGINNVVSIVGAESMSNAAFVLPGKVRHGNKMGNLNIVDTMITDALTDAFSGVHMGITAENIVSKYNITRQEQDQFALNSHIKSSKAIIDGKFKDEIVPITVKTRNQEFIVDTDESPRNNLTIDQLEKLRTVFLKEGTVTAGNASSLNDGAASIVIASEEAVKNHNLKPLARIIAIGEDGTDPQVMGLGPIGAINKALKNANLSLKDIDIIELNEAFAAQSIGVIKGLSATNDISETDILSKTNLNGGAISLGHPLGCSGARIVVTLIHLLQNHNKKYGLASLCIGGGMGISIIIERIA